MKIVFKHNPKIVKQAWIDHAEILDDIFTIEVTDADLTPALRARFGGPTTDRVERLTPAKNEQNHKFVECSGPGGMSTLRVLVHVPILDAAPSVEEAVKLLADYLHAQDEAQHTLDVLYTEQAAKRDAAQKRGLLGWIALHPLQFHY